MNKTIQSAVKEAVILILITVLVSLVVNHVRKDGIPLVADAEAFRVKTDAEFMRVEDALRLFEDGSAIFIDARDPEIFALGHIEGSMNVAASGDDIEDMAWLAGGDSEIICYASRQNQRQAGVVADRLIQMGFEKVFILYGGFEDWKQRGLPTLTTTD